MLRSVLIAVVCLAAPVLTHAQAPRTPDIEVFGGLSYLNARGYYEREHFGNVATGVTVNVNKYFGIVADVGLPMVGRSETYHSLVPGSRLFPAFFTTTRETTTTESALFGPRFFLRRERMTLFANGLAGVVRTRTRSEYTFGPVLGLPPEVSSFTYAANRFAYGFGGGIDVNLNRRFAIRIVQADYLRTHMQVTGNELRLQSGVVVRFGKGSH